MKTGKATEPQFATLKIDGKELRLIYNFNAIAEAEAITKCNLLNGQHNLLSGQISASELRGVLWANLRKAHPRITLSEVGDLIRLDTEADIYNALAEAYRLSLPNPPQAESGPAAESPSTTESSGSSSGPQPEQS